MNNNISAEISTSPKDFTPPIISSAKYTHEELRKRAVQWLTNTEHCGIVLSEMRAFTPGNEIPDAIGWQSHKSIVVECKTSRADFLANKHKPCSRSNLLMGSYRYFFCPAHLLTAEDLTGEPDDLADFSCDYGLLWLSGKQVRVVKPAVFRPERDKDGEIAMLASALRRVKTREFLTIVAPSEVL